MKFLPQIMGTLVLIIGACIDLNWVHHVIQEDSFSGDAVPLWVYGRIIPCIFMLYFTYGVYFLWWGKAPPTSPWLQPK